MNDDPVRGLSFAVDGHGETVQVADHVLRVVPTTTYRYRRYSMAPSGLYDDQWWYQFDPPDDREVTVPAFAIDEHEVTNEQFGRFISETGYRPHDPHGFLRHWMDSEPPEALGDHPVVWVSLSDARAYARWAGLRLPTEVEWQLAAQGLDGRIWPWGSEFAATRCNGDNHGTTPVSAFPTGTSPFGCLDMAGNVWEWTESEETDGSHRTCSLRSGSWYRNRATSGWYAHQGPSPVHDHLRFLLLDDAFDRSATVGFRCARTLPDVSTGSGDL